MKINHWILTLFILSLSIGCDDDPGDDPGVNPTPDIPSISIAASAKFEGNDETTMSFTVSLSSFSEENVSVDYTTDDLTTVVGTDYIAKSGVLVFPPGVGSKDIEIVLVTDSILEPDEEFQVILSDPVNATIAGTGSAIGQIRNDDTFESVPLDGYITPEAYPGYDLVWADEFNGNSINSSVWNHETGGWGWGNQELQNYTTREENSRIVNGKLVIEAKEESWQGNNYTSARMTTQGKKEFQYGRIDIRATLPEGQGIWPALWMLGANFGSVGWPHCGEMDIMELVGHEPAKVHGTAHWGPQGQEWSFNNGNSYNLLAGNKFSDKYHVFTLLWEENEVKWLVNDNQFFSLTPATVNGDYPFNDPFFFIFNIAVGGLWPGSPNASTVFPQKMTVDYIRVFQPE